MCSIIIRWMPGFDRRRVTSSIAIAPFRSRTLLKQDYAQLCRILKLRKRKGVGAVFLLRRHAGPTTFGYRCGRRNLISASRPASQRSLHLASHVCLETHSRSQFPLRWVAGHARSTIREFPHSIRLLAFSPQAHRNLPQEISCSGRRTSSDLHRRR